MKRALVAGLFAVLAFVVSSHFSRPSVSAAHNAAPTLSNTRIENIIGPSGQVRWETDDLADSRVAYGTSSSPLPFSSTARCDSGSFVTAHCINLSGLLPATTYFFKPYSVNVDGFEGSGPTYQFTTGAPGSSGFAVVPSGPTSLSVTVSSNTVTSSWTDTSSNEDHFEVSRRLSNGNWLVIGQSPANTAFYTEALPAPSGYDYQVTACASGGCSGGSNVVHVNIIAPNTTAPSSTVPAGLLPPSNLTAQLDENPVNVLFRWQDNSTGEDHFNLYMRKQATTTWNYVAALGAREVRYVYYGHPEGVWEYYLTACTPTQCSGPSNIATIGVAVPADKTPPAPIADLAATSTGRDSVRLSWTSTGDDGVVGTASTYIIRLSTSGPITAANFDMGKLLSLGIFPKTANSPESAVVTGLQSDTPYWFGVKVIDKANNASYSNSVVATPSSGSGAQPFAPQPPTNLSASANTAAVTLSWTDNSTDESRFDIYRRVSGGSWGNVGSVVSGQTTFIDTTVASGVSYEYQVSACSSVGCSSSNQTITVSVPGAAQQPAVSAPATPSGTGGISRTLKIGSQGEDVKFLQQRLLQEGVYPQAIINGYFGPLTRAAVSRFQEKYALDILTPVGLKAGTGVVGEGTRKKLNSIVSSSSVSNSEDMTRLQTMQQELKGLREILDRLKQSSQ